MSKEVYLIDGVRTAIGKFRGSLSTVRTDDLGAIVIKGLLDRNKTVDPELIKQD